MALIMIVDDDAHIQLALRQIVESAGHRVIEAGSGEEAAALFAEFHPDLVIADVLLPQADGRETIGAIRRVSPGAKIIAISGVCGDSAWHRPDSVVVLGANLALRKPFTYSQLLSSIDQMLSGQTAAEPDGREAVVAAG